MFTCRDAQIALEIKRDGQSPTSPISNQPRRLEYRYTNMEQGFVMSDAVDEFLLPQMESTRLTVYELDLSQLFFNWRFDAETNRWTD